ncbi:hypothetical protein CDD82_518 [Ophiocordyceps australis]|uniref:Uncharacterized protein n=1 Tax=Ophiocordyceps australis TaxID=1399860 RepID=A0A2C5ZNF6_9HYPO|nr:hypothetical protein CDD82_518 [Ophiocordyceps australis]
MSLSEMNHVPPMVVQWNYRCDLIPTTSEVTPELHSAGYLGKMGSDQFGKRPLHSTYFLKLVPPQYADDLLESSNWPKIVEVLDKREHDDEEVLKVFNWLFDLRKYEFWMCWATDTTEVLLDYGSLADQLIAGFVSVDSIKMDYSGISLHYHYTPWGISGTGACLHSSSVHYEEIRQLYRYVTTKLPTYTRGITNSGYIKVREILEKYADPFILAMGLASRLSHQCMHTKRCATVLGKGIPTMPTSFVDYWHMLGLVLEAKENICINFANTTLHKNYLHIDAGPRSALHMG